MKMKHLLISGLTLLTFTAVGQQKNEIRPANNLINSSRVATSDLENFNKTLLCTDTLSYPFHKELRLGTSAFYLFDLWTDDSEAISQKYDLNGSTVEVSGVEFYGRNNPNELTASVTVKASVWSVDGANNPVTELGSGTMVINDTIQQWRYINLAAPINVSTDYAVVIEPTNAGSVLQFIINDIPTGQVQDEDLSRMKSTYYAESNGNWVSVPVFSTSFGPFDFEGLISPIVSYTVDPNFTTTPSPACENIQVQFNNTSAVQDVLGSRMYNYDSFQTYFGISAIDSTYVYDFGDGSPAVFEENPTHTYTASGTYNVTQLNLGGVLRNCIDDVVIPLTINPIDDATFNYSASQYCTDEGNQTPTTAATGTFTATPAGLVFADANTGEINLAASSAGTYDVTFTTDGACPSSSVVTIEIIELNDATFSYASSTLCTGGANETPTINGTGTFTSSPAGLNFVNTSTGEIDMSTSTEGSYTVTFTTTGTCSDVSAETITITSAPDATFNYSGAEFCAEVGSETPTFPTGASAGTFTSTPAGLDINASNGTITLNGSSAGTYDVTNTIPASGSCPQATATETITIVALPNVDAGTDQEVCDGDEVTLTATGADNYTWDNGVTQGVAFNPSVGVETYTVTGENTTTGCENTDQVVVTVNALPTVDAGTDETACDFDDPLTLTGTPAGGTFSGTGVTGNEFDPSVGAGTYTITYTYTDGNGCEGSDNLTVTVDGCASIDENSISESIKIMPNPATDYIDVVIEGKNTINSIQLLSAEGRVVELNTSTLNASTTRIDVSSAAKGTYFIQINTLNGQITKKVILQ